MSVIIPAVCIILGGFAIFLFVMFVNTNEENRLLKKDKSDLCNELKRLEQQAGENYRKYIQAQNDLKIINESMITTHERNQELEHAINHIKTIITEKVEK